MEAIVSFCEELGTFPRRRASRDDTRPGLRTIGYGKRVIVAFAILDGTVAILGVFSGSRDSDSILMEPDSPPT